MSKHSYDDLIDDKFSCDYEEIREAASLFGIDRDHAVKLAILIELKEINRQFGNWSQGRKEW